MECMRRVATLVSFSAVATISVTTSCSSRVQMAAAHDDHPIRPDGVRMGYNPYTPDMMEKYGAPGATDKEGFDPYHDTVGPGIYGGRVKRDESTGEVVVGRQYQNHNSKPGPVYAGGGYTPMSKALGDDAAVTKLLDKYPDLVNEITTGGANPLHMCGMGRDNQQSTALLIERGGEIEAIDTYGYRPLHRMASNNLAVGAEALLKAGADPNARTSRGETPMIVAQQSAARDVIQVLQKYSSSKKGDL